MHRAAAAIGVTVVAMWLILSFKTSPASHLATGTNATTSSSTVPASDETGGEAPAGPPPRRPTASTTTTPPANAAARTVDGAVVSTRYGDVQVAVVLTGSQIVDVKPLQLPFDRPRSQDISSQAAPLLHDEVLQAQSAQIDTIGGATFTSEAYAESLQSALDRAHG